jgi:ParB-like chromosome segregation protein Spo0J
MAKRRDDGLREWPADKVERWPLDRIVPYERNPRTHPEEQIALLARLMREHGVDQPIVVDEEGVIIKGHGRLMAARLAAFETFPVVVKRGLTEEQKRADRIADNQVALLSGWDVPLLKEELVDLRGAGFEMPLLAFSDAQLAKNLAWGEPPADFGEIGEDIETEHRCPKCGYRWSGQAGEADG